MNLSGKLTKPLIQELLCVADSKWILGHWYIMVMRNGRSLSDFNALSGMSQDELGQTRALFRFLEEELAQPENVFEFERKATDIHDIELLDAPPSDWADFVCSTYLAEAAIWQFLATFRNSKLRPLANIVQQFGQETNFHLRYGIGWLKSFNENDMRAFKPAVMKRLPLALAWFGDAHARDDDPLLADGIRTKSLNDARDAFIHNNVSALCGDLGFEMTDVNAALKNLSLKNWDRVRHRPQGSAMPAQLWEFVLPTNKSAVDARRALKVSKDDNVLWTSEALAP